jgi:hypothetical protein
LSPDGRTEDHTNTDEIEVDMILFLSTFEWDRFQEKKKGLYTLLIVLFILRQLT